MNQILFVSWLTILISGAVKGGVCPHWAEEYHGGHVVLCCTIPHLVEDKTAYCARDGGLVGRYGDRQLCFKSVSSQRRKKRFGFLHGSPPPPPPTPPPGR